jgi:hypothetical protein
VAARKLTKLGMRADIIAVADAVLIDNILITSHTEQLSVRSCAAAREQSSRQDLAEASYFSCDGTVRR